MKLAPVLVKYLAINKELSLPGLGVFSTEGISNADAEHNKKDNSAIDIKFDQKKVVGLDVNLIDFVSKETGKMKVLAESDLISLLDNVLDFVNTGKPYNIPGIGTITKRMDGKLEFQNDKFQFVEKSAKHAPKTERNTVPQAYIDEPAKRAKVKPAIIILTLSVLLGIIAIVWYYVNSTKKERQHVEDITANVQANETKPSVSDSTKPVQNAIQTTSTVTVSDSYKYILEITKQPRASKRFNQLKSLKWPVEMDSKDSVNYRLFIKLPAANADTTRIKDSLRVLSGRKVWIEN